MNYLSYLALAALMASSAAFAQTTGKTPKPPSNVCLEEDQSKCAQDSGGGLKWHPGHYMISDNGATLSKRLSYCDEVGSLPYMKGLQVRMFWAQLEPTQGNYDFSAIRQLLNRCGGYGKRLMVEVWWRNFTQQGNNTGIIPSYVGLSNLYWTGDGYAATIWRPHVADRLIALFQAMGREFDSSPYFEMVSTKETAGGSQVTLVLDYSPAAYVTQMKRILSAARAAWPTTQVRVMANFISGTTGTNAQMIDLIKHARNNQIMIGGPDICAGTTCRQSQAQDILRGAVGGYDYRGEAGIIYNAELVSLVNPMYVLYDQALNEQKANYLSWLRNWNVTQQDWENDIKPYLAKNPHTNTACPTSMTCDTR